jgi:hypothetical protein
MQTIIQLIHFNYLQGTKTEVETVAANAKTTTWKVQTYTNTNATEDNFKLPQRRKCS